MIRNLKILGLALVAVFAMSAMAASAASAAQSVFTSDGPTTLDGVEDGVNQFVYPGEGTVTCSGSTFTGHEVGSTTNGIPNNATTATITPHYNNPNCTVNSGEHKATVAMNGCDFVFHLGETTSGTSEHGVTADVVCPGTSVIEVDVFFASNNENLTVCLLKIGPQNGLKGFDVSNDGSEKLTLTGETTEIHASKSGLCGAGSTTTASYKVNVTASGTNAAGGSTGIQVSD